MGDRDGKVFVAVAFGQAGANRERQYDSMENVYRTDPVDVIKGVHQFYSTAALPDIELQHVMSRDDEHPLEGAPDVFCYVYEKSTMGGCKRLGYVRLQAREHQGTANAPKWHKVQKDPYSDDSTFTGYLLMDVSVNTRQVEAHASHATRHTLHVTRHTSRVTRHTSRVTRHTSHVTRHASRVTHHTSHVTHHTSHHASRRTLSSSPPSAPCPPPPPPPPQTTQRTRSQSAATCTPKITTDIQH